MTLRFGIAVRDITPATGLPMGGYAARAGVAQGTLDPLFCRAAVLSDGVASVALVALDLVYVAAGWAGPLRDEIARRLGTRAENILVAATHTHAGPAVFHSSLTDSQDLRAYERQLADTALRAVDDACTAAQPAQLAWGEARCAGVAASRRDAAADIDDRVRVLVVGAPTGKCQAVVAVFGCHPTVLPPANLCYSRDLFGAAVDVGEALVGAPVVLFNGAAADVSTRFTRRGQTVPEVTRLGRALGESIAAAVSAAVAVAGEPLGAYVDAVPVATRPLPSVETAQRMVAEAAALADAAQHRRAEAGDVRRAAAQLEGALAQLFLAAHGPELLFRRQPDSATIQLLRIGDCDLLGAPGELFSRVGRQICSARARPTLLVGYANDYLGYIVPPAAAAAGGYEALTAVIEPASADELAERLVAIGNGDAER
jgi:hypothetical protein